MAKSKPIPYSAHQPVTTSDYTFERITRVLKAEDAATDRIIELSNEIKVLSAKIRELAVDINTFACAVNVTRGGSYE